MAQMYDICVKVPADVRDECKALGINMSRAAREAITAELNRVKAEKEGQDDN